MPNHTTNVLNVTGPTADVQRFVSLVSGGEENGFDFNTIVPMPEELKNTEKTFGSKANTDLITKFGFDNWYDWNVANWGTKWNAYDVMDWMIEGLCDGDTTTATITFYTAWTPPQAFLDRASEQFPSLFFSLQYVDEGGGFLGESHYENGKLSKTIDYQWDSEEGIALRQDLGVYCPENEEDEE